MNALPTGARAIRCACGARSGQPCTPGGDHLARYLAADAVGAITRDQLAAVVASLVVIASHVVVIPARLPARWTAPVVGPSGDPLPELKGAR